MDCLASPDVKNALDNTHKDFVVVPIDKQLVILLLFVKDFMSLLLLENWD